MSAYGIEAGMGALGEDDVAGELLKALSREPSGLSIAKLAADASYAERTLVEQLRRSLMACSILVGPDKAWIAQEIADIAAALPYIWNGASLREGKLLDDSYVKATVSRAEMLALKHGVELPAQGRGAVTLLVGLTIHLMYLASSNRRPG